MNRADWSPIAHAGIDLMNPLSVAKVDQVIELLELEPGARVIDLGCGKGELLRRIAVRYAIRGVGVDLSRELLDEARLRAPELELIEADVTTFESSQSFDVAASLGSPATLAQLTSLVGPGGRVLYGEGYWRRPPSPEYLAALGAAEDELTDYDGVTSAGDEFRLTLTHAVTASTDDFDRYEERWAENGERYAAAHPDEPGVDEFLAWIRNGRRRYVELGGRDTLGFGLFVFERVA